MYDEAIYIASVWQGNPLAKNDAIDVVTHVANILHSRLAASAKSV